VAAGVWATAGGVLPATAVMDPPRSRVVPMRHDPNGDAASIASAKGFEVAGYSMVERKEQPERWRLFKSQSDAMVAWFAAPMNVERSSACMVQATLDGHARAFASFLGFARHVHGLEPTVERFLDGPLMQRYATFLRSTRGCKVTTIVKHMGQLLNVLRFMRAPTGRALLQVCMGMCSLPSESGLGLYSVLQDSTGCCNSFARVRVCVQPPLSESEEVELGALLDQLTSLKKQLHAEALQLPKATPAQLTTEGKWAHGGFQALQDGAAKYARDIMQLVPQPLMRRELDSKAGPVLQLAARLSSAMLAMLVTALPPQRPRSLYTTVLLGVIGMADPVRPCTVCPRVGCRGNALVRSAPYTFTWILSHHKCQRTKVIPDQVISEANDAHPVLLEVMEAVRARDEHELINAWKYHMVLQNAFLCHTASRQTHS
jgi:hypothetical protein